jgi:hypothetical protein
MPDILHCEAPTAPSEHKILKDKIKHLEMKLRDDEESFKLLEKITEYRVTMYILDVVEWLGVHYNESPSYDVLNNSPYENIVLLNWISSTKEEKQWKLDSELEEYFGYSPTKKRRITYLNT